MLKLLDLIPSWLYAAAIAILAAAFTWQTVVLKGTQTDLAQVQAEHAQQETDRLREANREIARLVNITNHLNEAYREQIATIDDLERRAGADRVRVNKAQRDAAIAAGSAEAVREYAATASDHYSACRDEYRAVGYEHARGSATAGTLKQWIDGYGPAKAFDDKLTTFTTTLKGQ